MKTLKRSQMKGFEGSSLQELIDDYNRKMEWIGIQGAKHSDPVIDIQTLRGFVIYEEVVKIPECKRDQLDLAGLRACCGDCKQFVPTRYGAGNCCYCRGELRKGDECCMKFFDAWDHGDCWLSEGKEDEYREVINEPGLASICCSA